MVSLYYASIITKTQKELKGILCLQDREDMVRSTKTQKELKDNQP